MEDHWVLQREVVGGKGFSPSRISSKGGEGFPLRLEMCQWEGWSRWWLAIPSVTRNMGGLGGGGGKTPPLTIQAREGSTVGMFPLRHLKREWEGFVVAMGNGSWAGSPLLLKMQHKGWRMAKKHHHFTFQPMEWLVVARKPLRCLKHNTRSGRW